MPQSGVVWEGIWSVAEVNNWERGIEPTETKVNTLLVPNIISRVLKFGED